MPTDPCRTAPQRAQHGDIGPKSLVIAAMLSRATLLPVRAFAIPAHEMIDVVLILVDQPLDLLATRAGLWSGIGDGTAQSNVVADEIRACRILERILHVGLLHLEVTVDIATIVCLAAFRHLLLLRFVWSDGYAPTDVGVDPSRKPQAVATLSLDQQHEISTAFPEPLGVVDPQPISVHPTVRTDTIRKAHVLAREHAQTRVAERG